MWHSIDKSERDLHSQGASENATVMVRLSTYRTGRQNNTEINSSQYTPPFFTVVFPYRSFRQLAVLPGAKHCLQREYKHDFSMLCLHRGSNRYFPH